MKQHRRFWIGLCALPVASLALIGVSLAQQDGPLGKSQQALVGGKVIDPSTQEDFTLLNLNDSCSASLLRNGWAITAAHCVETGGGNKTQMPDPARPGQFILDPIPNIRVKANWRETQERRAVRVVTFRPYDVAIIQLDAPFKWHGTTTGFSRLMFQDGQFPYWGDPVGASMLAFGRGIYQLAQGQGASATPAKGDGQFRFGAIRPNAADDKYYYFSNQGVITAGGDSGGPSFAWTLNGYALVGVHSFGTTTRVPGKPTAGWDWVNGISRAGDAFIAPIINQIFAVIGPMPPGDPEPALEPPPHGYIGTFSKSPPNYQPMWVYGIRWNGDLNWYRKDTNAAAWEGPRKVADDWTQYKDVIAAGGNRFYALTNDNRLLWFQHNGFNDGSFSWGGPVRARSRIEARIDAPIRSIKMLVKGTEVGRGWGFKRIFSGGEGIVYAIRQDGKLFWYRHIGYTDGSFRWVGGHEVGSQWGGYKDVFCLGQGKVYAVTWDGKLMVYQQKDYLNGPKDWHPARQVGSGWNGFRQIIPVGDGVILAVTYTGKLLWYRHYYTRPNRLARYKEVWEGPVEIGSGWQDFSKVVALIPVPSPQVVR